ncbi:MAG: nucleotide exchange factor GrpE [Actinomycetia bacterium]|nr:nucleotide exchange factor GrpE [Actinomycetes bacterium]
MSPSDGPSPEGAAPDPAEGPTDADPSDGLSVEAMEATEQTAESAVAEAVELARRFEGERDEYLDHLRRLQAEFENYKRRTETQASEQRARAATDLVRELLPVLDACDAALSHGEDQVEPVRAQLLGILEAQGLKPVGELGEPFDPNIHEAVMHEAGEGDAVVAEVMRTGYLWKDLVVRAAMVKVRG